MNWQPIETAPKGKKLIAGYRNDYGKWRITVDYPDQPPVQNGDRVLVEKADIPRPQPSSGHDNA